MTVSGNAHLAAGAWAEEQAVRHLETHGLRLLTRNFRCRLGEIDAVMRDGEMLVFVEVRFRRNDDYGSALESVTWSKQRKLLAAARAYLGWSGLADRPSRFDVVSVSKRNCRADFLWIRDAFGQD